MKDIFSLDIYWSKGLFGGFQILRYFAIWFEREFDNSISFSIHIGSKIYEKRWEQ